MGRCSSLVPSLRVPYPHPPLSPLDRSILKLFQLKMQGQLRELIEGSCAEWVDFFRRFSLASVEMKETLNVYRRRSLVNPEPNSVTMATAAAAAAAEEEGVAGVKVEDAKPAPVAAGIAANFAVSALEDEQQEGSTMLHEILANHAQGAKQIFTTQRNVEKRVIQSSWDKPMSWYPPLFQIKLLPERTDSGGFTLRFDPPLDLFKETCVGVLDEMGKTLGEMETINHEMLPLLMLEPSKLYPLMQGKQICAESDQCIENARSGVADLIESEIRALKALAALYEEFIPLLSLKEEEIVQTIKKNELGRRVPVEGSVRCLLLCLSRLGFWGLTLLYCSLQLFFTLLYFGPLCSVVPPSIPTPMLPQPTPTQPNSSKSSGLQQKVRKKRRPGPRQRRGRWPRRTRRSRPRGRGR